MAFIFSLFLLFFYFLRNFAASKPNTYDTKETLLPFDTFADVARAESFGSGIAERGGAA